MVKRGCCTGRGASIDLGTVRYLPAEGRPYRIFEHKTQRDNPT